MKMPTMGWHKGRATSLGGGSDTLLPQGPPPGCILVGTECRVFHQTCKYCCSNGGTYSEACGWCAGWWDAPPCLGF